jgi:hypothetical protein
MPINKLGACLLVALALFILGAALCALPGLNTEAIAGSAPPPQNK